MRDVSPAVKAFALDLLHHESDNEPDAVKLAMETHRIHLRLEDRLSRLFGRSGYSALLGRAVYLAKRDFHELDPLLVERDTQGGLLGLCEFGATHASNPEFTAEALSSILAHFIWLLVSFIGVEMTVRLIIELWPDLAESAGVLYEQEG